VNKEYTMGTRLTQDDLAKAHHGLCGVSLRDGPCSCLVQWVEALQQEADGALLQLREAEHALSQHGDLLMQIRELQEIAGIYRWAMASGVDYDQAEQEWKATTPEARGVYMAGLPGFVIKTPCPKCKHLMIDNPEIPHLLCLNCGSRDPRPVQPCEHVWVTMTHCQKCKEYR
jgi:hypothetical protein